jgi:ATP-dependent Clp protease adaptor protein ClpS
MSDPLSRDRLPLVVRQAHHERARHFAARAEKREAPDDGGGAGDDGAVVVTEKKNATRLERPRLFKVLLHNDDYTTMEFVVAILISVFHHSETDAVAIMLSIHTTGRGIAGIFPFDVAETKVAKVMALAAEAQFPLLCTLEPES